MFSYHIAAHIDWFLSLISHITYLISPPCSPYRLVLIPSHSSNQICLIFALLNCRFASIGPVAGSPFLGYAQVPDRALSIIDFHGTADQTIPYSLPTSEGSGPDGTVISFDGYFYYDKPRVISGWAEGLDCGPASPWPTSMDGVQGFTCLIHSECRGGGEVVHCNANYGHDYPFGPDRYIEGSRIMWNFMKAHPKEHAGLSEKTGKHKNGPGFNKDST